MKDNTTLTDHEGARHDAIEKDCRAGGCRDESPLQDLPGLESHAEDALDSSPGFPCEPGEQICLSTTVVGVCTVDGAAWEALPCPEGEGCEVGHCFETICSPSQTKGKCAGPTTIWICNDSGTNWIDQACESPLTCFEGVCVDYQCPPGEKLCKGLAAVQECLSDNEGGYEWIVVETCDSSFCVEGACLTACQLNLQEATNLGCEFWAVDLDNVEGGQYRPVGIEVSVPATQAYAEITITDMASNPPKVLGAGDLNADGLTVLPGTSKVFALPGGHDVDGSSHTSRSFRVQSTSPAFVHQFNPLNGLNVYTNDASLLFPAQTGGTEYIVMSWPMRTQGYTLRGFLAVVATEDGVTSVEVSPSTSVLGGTNIPSMTADPPIPCVFSLEQGDVLNLETDGSQGSDLTGTTIVSDKKVSVFGGHECANIPLGTNYCDHVEQQLFPVQAWGAHYIGDAFKPRTTAQKDIWRILSGADNVQVTLSPPVAGPFSLNKGQWVEFHTGNSFHVNAAGPILLGHFLQGSNYSGFEATCSMGTGIGDPAFTLAVTTEQYLNEYAVLTPKSYEQDYVNITFKAGTETKITIDGVSLSQYTAGTPVVPVGNTAWAVAQVSVSDGLHTIVSQDQPIGVTAYGYDCDVSYAYPGGLGLKPLQGQQQAGATQCIWYHHDEDNDGYGMFETRECLAEPSEDHTAVKFGDCDDSNPQRNPNAADICDDIDNDCDGVTDEGCDEDGDDWCNIFIPVVGFPNTCPFGPGDCYDGSSAVNPAQLEVPGDGVDNDCDGIVDEPIQCPGPCMGHSVDAYLCAMEMCFGPAVISAGFTSPTGDNIDTAWEAVAHFGSADNDLTPITGSSYVLLATGPATGTSHTADLAGGGSTPDPFANDGYQTYDNVEFKVLLTAPQTAIGFAVDYVFFSTEYEEYIGTSFNDKFYIVLKGPQTTNNQKTVINYTACSNPGSYFDFTDGNGEKKCYIAINTVFSEPCSNPQTDISGTGFECGPPDSYHGSSTCWLRTAWPIQPNETFELIFHIHDTSDGICDSEVILDNFHWLSMPFTPGTTSHD